jgi:hypothetical protein
VSALRIFAIIVTLSLLVEIVVKRTKQRHILEVFRNEDIPIID